MATTAQEHLDLINTAISNLVGADALQEYQIHGRRYRAADLPSLYRIRRELQAEVTREAGSSVRVARLGRARGVDRT